MKTARLIYNPTSGREEMKKRLADILDRLDIGGIETSCHATTGEGDATAATIDAVERGTYDLIIAAGGDGTLNEVINGMAERPNLPRLAYCRWVQPMILPGLWAFRRTGRIPVI